MKYKTAVSRRHINTYKDVLHERLHHIFFSHLSSLEYLIKIKSDCIYEDQQREMFTLETLLPFSKDSTLLFIYFCCCCCCCCNDKSRAWSLMQIHWLLFLWSVASFILKLNYNLHTFIIVLFEKALTYSIVCYKIISAIWFPFINWRGKNEFAF